MELRDTDAESEIDAQILSQIRAYTGSSDTSWDRLRAQLRNPPLVILDGYDELLQASGRVFQDYLMKVRRFQEREHWLGRPVRIFVTSRSTLIDKAEIPQDTTIVRLEEFDAAKQKKWISIWNSTNSHYFLRGLKKFALPDDRKLQPLAAQPLLLLMLALFDSDDNQLSKSKGLDQTLLYDSLLKRFVERERLKGEEGKEFRGWPRKEQDAEIDRDIHRLGVVAMGMFNRRSLHVLTRQLNDDLEFFQLGRVLEERVGGVAMTPADLLLGSFFFIHESKNGRSGSGRAPNEADAAFEFLHNTFGEFLTADFILRAILDETENLEEHESSPRLQAQMVERLARKIRGVFRFRYRHKSPRVVQVQCQQPLAPPRRPLRDDRHCTTDCSVPGSV